MAILLPSVPLEITEVSLVSKAWDLSPTFGGPDQRIARMGDRWLIKFTSRGMSYEQGMGFVAAVAEGLNSKVRIAVPQPGFTGTDATVSSGSGRTLVKSGGGTVSPGQYFSLVHTNGVRYLHRVVSVAGSTLSIQPMLKVTPSAGSTLEFVTPQIEGFIQEGSLTHTVSMTGTVNVSFAIKEAQ